MTKIISSSTQLLAPAVARPAAHLDDDDDGSVCLHVVVSSSMFFFFFLYAHPLWTVLGHWYDVIIAAIAFPYCTVMIHLLLIKHRDQKKRQELEACELTSTLMLVATGIMLISLGFAIFVFHPDLHDLVFIAFTVLLSTAPMFVLLKVEEINRKKILGEKCEDASDLV